MNAVDITLYGIVDPNRSKGRSLAELAKTSAENGATLIQYRDKQNDIRTMIENAKSIKQSLEGTNVPFIVNDRVDIALASGADGVHLGQEDMIAADARRLLGQEAIIGLSIKTNEQAEAAPIEILDYAFVGGHSQLVAPVEVGSHSVIGSGSVITKDVPPGALALARIPQVNKENYTSGVYKEDSPLPSSSSSNSSSLESSSQSFNSQRKETRVPKKGKS